MVHVMRATFPITLILLCKYDLDAVYQRLHTKASLSIKCICVTAKCILVYLCLTFGGSFSLAKWCVLIEIITDIANDITNNTH
jgi:hypothetical protein